MDRLTKLTKLLNFLRVREPSLEKSVQFVTLDTLDNFSAFTAFINVVRIDGSVHIPAGFGYDQKFFARIPNRLVSTDTPINHTLRTGEFMEAGDYDEYVFAGEGYAEKLFPHGFAQSFAIPIPGVGALVVFCSRHREISIEDREFLCIVGKILSRSIKSGDSSDLLGGEEVIAEIPTKIALTTRQWKILGGIKRGLTNEAISGEMLVSESLVRQETVQIYKKLGVSGRKEILSGDDLDEEKSGPSF